MLVHIVTASWISNPGLQCEFFFFNFRYANSMSPYVENVWIEFITYYMSHNHCFLGLSCSDIMSCFDMNIVSTELHSYSAFLCLYQWLHGNTQVYELGHFWITSLLTSWSSDYPVQFHCSRVILKLCCWHVHWIT